VTPTVHSSRPAADVLDVGPVAHVTGRLLVVLALAMMLPALVDFGAGDDDNGRAFLRCFAITGIVGLFITIATRHRMNSALNTRQAFLLTFAIWTVTPAFGALPFIAGAPGLSFTDAYFESVSGITTTGATVIVGLDNLPAGMNLWRGMLNWLGGLGIVFIVMIFLPLMRVGGMQFFRTEGFDTLGKVLPRAVDISKALLLIYVGLTALFAAAYLAVGMSPLDAAVHAMSSVATGGFSPNDSSFSVYPPVTQYLGALFMAMASLPFIRYVQMVRGSPGLLPRDAQVLGFFGLLLGAVAIVTLWKVLTSPMPPEQAFRESLFNLTSIFSGTGFFAGSYGAWEGPAVTVAFALGFVGGCSGSSSGGLSVFRVQLAFKAIAHQIRLIQSPHTVAPIRYDGRAVAPDVIDTLMLYVTAYVLILGLCAVAMGVMGVDSYSAVMGSWQALGNIGYGYGPLVVRTGTFIDFPDGAVWVMTLAMLMGRLGLLTIVVVVLPRFWRD
jgi:trk system potassium uptake protein